MRCKLCGLSYLMAFGPSRHRGPLGPSWRPLGASWKPLGPSGGHLGRLGAIIGFVGALLDRLGGLWGPSEAIRRALKTGPGSSGICAPTYPGVAQDLPRTCSGSARGTFRSGTPSGRHARAN